MSKSVKLIASAPTTGTTKNAAIAASAGATKSQPATVRLIPFSPGGPAIEHPAPLFENAIGARIQVGRCIVGSEVAVHHAFYGQAHFGRNALPFGYLGRGPDAFELVEEGA